MPGAQENILFNLSASTGTVSRSINPAATRRPMCPSPPPHPPLPPCSPTPTAWTPGIHQCSFSRSMTHSWSRAPPGGQVVKDVAVFKEAETPGSFGWIGHTKLMVGHLQWNRAAFTPPKQNLLREAGRFLFFTFKSHNGG